MAIDHDAKKTLDLRLARGEINREEYLAVCKLLDAVGQSSARSFLKQTLNSVISLKERVSESRKLINPTDLAPYQVSDEITLFSDHLTYGKKLHPYTTIERIYYAAHSHSINLIPTWHDASLRIQIKNSDMLFAHASKMMLKGKAITRILNAYQFLMRITFEYRLEPYVQSLQANGYCQNGATKFFINGDVEQDGVRVNLKVAHKQKPLAYWGTGSDQFTNYDVIKINETGKLLSDRRLTQKWTP